ncbi:MAG: transcriptional repressor [Patescibacteria group bacterium]
MFNLINNHDCKTELKKMEVKITPVRLFAMKFFESAKQPVDVSEIISYFKNNNIKADPATIFRLVNVFVEKGILKRIDFGEGKTRYELSNKGDHHHLICTNCGHIESVEDSHMSNFEAEIKKDKGFIVKSHSLEFFGICLNCQS